MARVRRELIRQLKHHPNAGATHNNDRPSHQVPTNSRERTESLKSISSKLIETGVIVVITGVVLAGYFFDSNGGNFRVLIALFAVATLKLMPVLRSALSQYSVIKSNRYTLEIIKEVNKESNIDNDIVSNDKEPVKFDHKLEFRNVSFGFEERELKLSDFSITTTVS